MWIKSLVGVVSRFHQKPQENQLEGVENQYQDMEEKVVVIKRSFKLEQWEFDRSTFA